MSTNNEQSNCDVHLHAEIETLKQALVEKQNQLISMETACLRESDRQAELEDSIIAWQDKYDRLYESHKRVQKVNQNLEDKLLKLVDRNSGERAQLTSDVATLSVRLAQANYNIAKLQREIERYKTDINLAIQLLQCKPDSFIPQKVSSLPMDIQSKVSSYMRLETNSHSDSEGSTSGVGVATSSSYKVLPASDSPPPICPFPPTAMVYSMRGLDAQNTEPNDQNEQMISPSIVAKYLEDELKTSEIKHCDTCNCSNKDLQVLADEPKTYSIGTQTILLGDTNSSLCLRCNSNLNSPSRTNSPYIMKLVRSSDSVISETKSSVSDFNDADKLFTPAKKDDLMVNPILGHHRLCDRTINNNNNNNNSKNNSNNINSNYNGNKQYQSTIISTNGTISLSGAIGNNSINHHQLNNNDTAKYLIENQYNNNTNNTNNSKNNNNNNRNNSINNTNTSIINNNINMNNIKNDICTTQNDDDHDLIDLNKFVIKNSSDTNKSPIMAVKNDITCNNTTYINCGNSQQVSDTNKKLLNNNNTSRKSDSYNLLIDETANESKNDLVQGSNCNGSNNNTLKNSDSVIENTDDKKFIDNNTNDSLTSGIFDRSSNLQTSATGSTNSLWSKTSSNEGAKIFENFNRNLIKTIKAENPKYHGPRLCALRIQNGSNNILLDGMESEVTPILYTRRQRFLDEELDDNKDVITSKISMVMSPNSDVINSPTSRAALAAKVEASSVFPDITDILTAVPLSPNKQNNPNDNYIPSEHSQQIIKDNIDNKLQQNTNLTNTVINNKQLENQDNSINSMNDNKLKQNNPDNLLDQRQQQKLLNSPNIKNLRHQHHHLLQHRQQYQYHLQQQQHTLPTIQNYDITTLCDNSINSSCKNTTNSKSCTQSSSISSNCPDTGVDLQENALLRCQQLTRVAEWVQNNSQMGQNVNNHNKLLMSNSNTNININNATTICNFNDSNNVNNNVSDVVSNSNYSSSICSNSNHHNIDNTKFSLENNNTNNNNNSNASIDILSNNGFKCKIKKQQFSSNTTNDNAQQRQPNKKQLTKNLSLSSTTFNCNYSELISTSNTNNNNTINLNDNKFKNQYQCAYMNANDNKTIVAQNKHIINRKYYNEENKKNLLKAQQYQKSKQLNGEQDWQQQQNYQQLDNEIIDKQNNNINNDEEQQVDLAQMEYNVKQFLLKQNEWSIRNKSIKSTTTSSSSSSVINNSMSTINTNAVAVTAANAVTPACNDTNVKLAIPPPPIDYCHNSNNPLSSDIIMPAVVKSHPHRTETNL